MENQKTIVTIHPGASEFSSQANLERLKDLAGDVAENIDRVIENNAALFMASVRDGETKITLFNTSRDEFVEALGSLGRVFGETVQASTAGGARAEKLAMLATMACMMFDGREGGLAAIEEVAEVMHQPNNPAPYAVAH